MRDLWNFKVQLLPSRAVERSAPGAQKNRFLRIQDDVAQAEYETWLVHVASMQFFGVHPKICSK